MRMLVLGAGLQGTACAFDLLRNADVESVRLAGLPIENLPRFLGGFEERLLPTPLDVREHAAVNALMRESDAVLCALPYYFNLEMTRLAIEARAPYCDLGGNTDVVLQQRDLNDAAVAAGVSVIPDCGLAPGMVNILAEEGIGRLDDVNEVRLYVGGLPKYPEPPLNYRIVYSLEGVLDYYTTPSWILRDGKRTSVSALTEVERLSFGPPLGELEAFHTAGGLSTMGFRYEGLIRTMEYKTLRYPGHAAVMTGLRELGFFDLEPVHVKGHRVVPRDVAVAIMEPRLTRPDAPDLVVMRVDVRGRSGGRETTVRWELLDYFDRATGVSAMMRTTGYSLAITGWMQASGRVATPGVRTPDEAVPAPLYVEELRKRGIDLRQTITTG